MRELTDVPDDILRSPSGRPNIPVLQASGATWSRVIDVTTRNHKVNSADGRDVKSLTYWPAEINRFRGGVLE